MSLIAILTTGIYFTIAGTSFYKHTIGTLVNANSDSYYKTETFRYVSSGYNKTCTLTRPTCYIYYGNDVEIDANNTLIGTTKEIWIESYNLNVCVDKALKIYNFTVGITLLSCFGFVMLFVLFLNLKKIFFECSNKSNKTMIETKLKTPLI